MFQEILSEFEKFSKKFPSEIPYSVQFGDRSGGILLTFCMHGNELGPAYAALELMEMMALEKMKYDQTVTFALGNILAIENQSRYVDFDVNRSFFREESEHTEIKRNREIAHLMRKADINLDFHQTVKETRKPFILGVDNPSNWELVRNISICDIFIEEPSENARRYGTLTGYADFLGKRHLCIEVSELSEREQAFNLTMKSVSSLLGYEKRDTEREIKKLKTVHSEAFSHKCMQLVPDLQNLEEVRKGQSLGSDGQGGDILCPFDGYLLFPKYLPRNGDGEVIGRLPLDIFELAVEI